MFISALTRLSETGQKFFQKFFCKRVLLTALFRISLLSFIHKIFEEYFYQYVCNSQRSEVIKLQKMRTKKRVSIFFTEKQKRTKPTKADVKRILCKPTLILDTNKTLLNVINVSVASTPT